MWIWRLTSDPTPDAPEVASALEHLFQPPDWTWAKHESIGWWVHPAWRDALLDRDGHFRLDPATAQIPVEVVKQGPHRVVYRADLGHDRGTVYVKHYLVPTRRARWRQWLRRGKGRNEARRAARLALFGIPTIEPVALGEERRGRLGFLFENWLVSPELTDSQPLDHFLEHVLPTWPAEDQTRVQRWLAAALGDLTARLHEGRFVHTDFHPGNILIRGVESDQPCLAMIDLDALRIRSRFRWSDAVANLACLNHYFWIRSSRSQRLRFLRHYLARRCGPRPDLRTAATQVENATRTWAERLWRRGGRRAMGSNKYFTQYRAPHVWAIASNAIDSAVVTRLMAGPDAPLTSPGRRLIKDSRTTVVAEVPLNVGGQDVPVIYKRFNRKKWLDPILALFRPSRGWRAWRNGQHLESRGVPTPPNLLVIGRTAHRGRLWSRHFCPHETYLATTKAEPARTLREFIDSELPVLTEPDRRLIIRGLTQNLARLIRTLHERSLSHRDLKAANILVSGWPGTPPGPLCLIDLVGVEVANPLPRHRQVQNLARLWLSVAQTPGITRTDALRFLKNYLPWANLGKRGWHDLWRSVERATHHKTALNLRRHRILS